jgi:hypothetical protein
MKKLIFIIVCLIIVVGLLLFVYKNSKTPSKNVLRSYSSPTPIQTASPSAQPVTPLSFTPEQLQGYYATYKDPYVINLRKALNGYLDGTNYGMDDPASVIKPDTSITGLLGGLSSFDKSYYQSKFIVYSIDNSLAGGKEIYIVFQDKPDKVFYAWVYKLAGGTYDLRAFAQDLEYTPDKMLQIQQEYKTFLNDKTHAL